MARMHPEFLSDEYNNTNPETIVFESLKQLSDDYSVIHSKKIKGGSKHREEVEQDFIIFDGKKNLIGLEVKGGEISFNAHQNKWFQNGKEMHKKPDWQASRACHAIIDFLGPDATNININWALCFPQSTKASNPNQTKIAEAPLALLLDEGDLDTFAEPTDILILTNKPMPESSIKPIDKVSGVSFKWTGRKPNNKSKCIQVSNISNFKGLEAPVVLIIGLLNEDVKNLA